MHSSEFTGKEPNITGTRTNLSCRRLLCACIEENFNNLQRLANNLHPTYYSEAYYSRRIRKYAQEEVDWAICSKHGDAFSSLKNACDFLDLPYDNILKRLWPVIIRIKENFQ